MLPHHAPLLLWLVRLRICVSPGWSFLANCVSRFASGTESGAGRILEPKPNLSRNHFSSNLISGSANIMPSPTYISLWYFSRSFPQVLKRQSVDRVPCPLSFYTSFLSSWLEAKLSPGRQQMDPNTSMDMFMHLLCRPFHMLLVPFHSSPASEVWTQT